jgi:hypothetical protein
LNPGKNRREILDWYHLIENLYKVGWSLKRLAKAKDILWKGQSDRTIDLFKLSLKKIAQNFCNYLKKHRSRIVNYEQLSKQQICSIGSGAVEATVKPIDRRLKISLFSMVEKKCQSNAKTSLCLPQRPVGHLRLLQNRDAPVKNSKIYCTFPDLLSNCDLDHPQS